MHHCHLEFAKNRTASITSWEIRVIVSSCPLPNAAFWLANSVCRKLVLILLIRVIQSGKMFRLSRSHLKPMDEQTEV